MKQTQVLIESDWNLKVTGITFRQTSYEVLIESDWNLKTMPVTATGYREV